MVGVSHTVACTYEIQANATVAHAIGTTIGFRQVGAGQLEITEDAGVTIQVPPGKTAFLRGQYSVASAMKVATNEWYLFGDLEDA
jgi:hypothetical protein